MKIIILNCKSNPHDLGNVSRSFFTASARVVLFRKILTPPPPAFARVERASQSIDDRVNVRSISLIGVSLWSQGGVGRHLLPRGDLGHHSVCAALRQVRLKRTERNSKRLLSSRIVEENIVAKGKDILERQRESRRRRVLFSLFFYIIFYTKQNAHISARTLPGV